jgi:hypothetical protein
MLAAGAVAAPAHAATTPLDPGQIEAFMRASASTPAAVTAQSDYFQDLGTRKPFLCFRPDTVGGKVRFEPVELSKTVPVSWLATQGSPASYYIRIYQFPDAASAKKAGSELVAAKCPDSSDSKYYLQQTKRTVTPASNRATVAITSSMKDDGQIETTDTVFRVVGNALLEVTVTYAGKPDSQLGKRLHAQLPKSLDKVAAAYRSAAG